MSRRPSVSANALSLLSLWLLFLRSLSSTFYSSILPVIEHIWAHNLLIFLFFYRAYVLFLTTKGLMYHKTAILGESKKTFIIQKKTNEYISMLPT
jgi:hypothetical protein